LTDYASIPYGWIIYLLNISILKNGDLGVCNPGPLSICSIGTDSGLSKWITILEHCEGLEVRIKTIHVGLLHENIQ
jgi:hypothetical protein